MPVFKLRETFSDGKSHSIRIPAGDEATALSIGQALLNGKLDVAAERARFWMDLFPIYQIIQLDKKQFLYYEIHQVFFQRFLNQYLFWHLEKQSFKSN